MTTLAAPAVATRTAVRLPPNLFATAFGLCGLGQCWAIAANQGAVPRWPADLIFIVAALVWLVTLFLYGRNVLAGGRSRTELDDPIFAPFTALIVIVPMLLGVALSVHARTAGEVLYAAGLALTVLCGGWLSGSWILADLSLAQWHPGYFLPTVAGGYVASAGASALGWHPIAELMFGYASVCWIVLGSILLLRLFTQPRLPVPLLPTMAIELAPPVVGGLAWFGVNGGRVDAVALGLAGYGILMVLVQVRLVEAYRTVPFGPGWWAFAFSYAAAFAVGIHWLGVTHAAGRDEWTWLLLAVVTVLVGYLTAHTAWALSRRTYIH